ncbi:MAG: extracellular solute-binding protein [Eubacteriales bacterium]|jgi:hypothetical protein
MRTLRIICLLLVCCLVFGLFAACGSEGEDKSKDDQSKPATSDTSESGNTSSEGESSEEDTDPLSHIPLQNLDRDIVFLVENQNGGGYGSREIVPMEDSPIAVYVEERNMLIEDRLGVRIKERRTDNMANDLRVAAQAGADFDIAMPYLTTAGPLIQENLFYDLYEFDDIINFDAPYWDQNAEESLSMGNKLYLTTGDFSVLSMDVTHCMLFNKTLVQINNLDNPYDLVNEGKWTMDKMLTMAKAITSDTDGKEGITFEDTIGLFINGNYANSLFIGSGENFARKNANGVPELTLYNSKSVDVVEKIFEIFSDPAVLIDEDFNAAAQAAGFTNCYWAARHALGTNRALFVTISLSDILNMAQYTDSCDFGLLVTPKYSEEQDRYYSYISIIYATGCVIPVSNAEPEVAALVLEALAAASTSTVKLNYYERILKLQKIQDEESERMLDFIFDNRVYDIGALFNWNNLRDFVATCVRGAANTFAQQYDANVDAFQRAMQDTIDYYSQN